MALEPITRRNYVDADIAAVQDEAISSAYSATEAHIRRYKADPRSFGGRYVCADLFKETFASFAASRESRGRYNGAVHNAAAVLAAEQFRRQIALKDEPNLTKAIFLTGSPGAGKTSSVTTMGGPSPDVRVIFEGQMVNPETSIEKIQAALDANLSVDIVVVHPLPETALDNTLHRFQTEGRGASINVMAQIQGGLRTSLNSIHEHFGDKVNLFIADKRDFLNPVGYEGWEHLSLLASEGNNEQIRTRLSTRLEQYRTEGRIDSRSYQQATGQTVESNPDRDDRGLETNEPGSGIPGEDRQNAFIGFPPPPSSGGKSRPPLYETVAERLIEQLENGTAPWQRPWAPGELRGPYNPTTDRPYRGGNGVWLRMQGHEDPRWMTYRQAEGLGAQVRKGEKGTPIVYWKTQDTRPLKDEQGNPVLDENGQPRKVTVLLERPRPFGATVFNATQIDGLPPLEPATVLPEPERHEKAEKLLADSGAAIRHVRGNNAYYAPIRDEIVLPERNQFLSPDGYYAAALHELGHWTGHSSRLDRDLSGAFGSELYAREELRAEIASLMIGEELGIGHDPGQHAAYVGSWIKALKEDPQEIFRASRDAEKILGFLNVLEIEREQEASMETENDQTPETLNSGSSAKRRIYLDVPFKEKDQAKALGAKWDRANKTWYIPEGIDPEPFKAWVRPDVSEAQVQAESPATSDPTPVPKSEGVSESRRYLAVPFTDKDQARDKGARWDKDAKAWYAPEGTDLEASGLARWLPENIRLAPPSVSPTEQFREALHAAGLIVDGEIIADGAIHRVSVEGDRGGQKSGAYALHLEDRVPGGYIQNFKTGEVCHFKAHVAKDSISEDERKALEAEAQAHREAREARKQQGQDRTAAIAKALWNEAHPAPVENPYLASKGLDTPQHPFCLRIVPDQISETLNAQGVLIATSAPEQKALREENPEARVFIAGSLLVPAQNLEGEIRSLQVIVPGFKSFLKEGQKTGLFAIAGAESLASALAQEKAGAPMPIIIAEGYATAATVARLLDQPVIVAFDSGNLGPVATALREKYPERTILFAADNDLSNPKENVGLSSARSAAEKVGGGVMTPSFDSEKGSDWNDHASLYGEAATRTALQEELAGARYEAAVALDRMTAAAHDLSARAATEELTGDIHSASTLRNQAESTLLEAASTGEVVRVAISDAERLPSPSASANVREETVLLVQEAQEAEIEAEWWAMSQAERDTLTFASDAGDDEALARIPAHFHAELHERRAVQKTRDAQGHDDEGMEI